MKAPLHQRSFVGWSLYVSGGLLIWEVLTLKVAVLLVICVWCFARFYYFTFYVIQHYVDEQYKFAGLWSFVKYLWRRRRE